MAITYRGCTLTRTSTTTDVRRVAFGRPYQAIGYIWRITGRLTTDGRGQQWLTSAAACREWIRGQDSMTRATTTTIQNLRRAGGIEMRHREREAMEKVTARLIAEGQQPIAGVDRVWGYRRIARFAGRDGGQCGHLHATADLARACQSAGGCRIERESCLSSDLHTELR